ncbi:hypothetical protein HPP92_004233 [Vanilla planifolia]|uniref:DM2 domain-containing protein n=1 Tax=Vanilla planifolia TaxID=51239 RepID=A0A835VA72_VANPL|nr:hypothetical protein HPP92_004233 [Vanilla planifolia]
MDPHFSRSFGDQSYEFAFNSSNFSDRVLQIEIVAAPVENKSDGEGCTSICDWVRQRKRRREEIKRNNGFADSRKNPENAFGNFINGLGERPFIIDDELEYGIDVDKGNGDESEDESDLFDSVCSICDNGGELLCCEGRCLRSFHATKRAGEDSDCASLGLQRDSSGCYAKFFLCKNCQLKKHQCFACGSLVPLINLAVLREISFEDIEGEDIIQRAWEGLLPNRILIYCMKHDIDNELGTPARDHIIFPESLDKKRERDQLKPKLNKDKQASDSVTGDINLAKHVKKIEKKAADGSHKLKIAKAFSKQSIDSSQPTWKASMKVAKSALEKVESKEIVKSALTKMEELKLKIGRASIDKTKVSDSAVNVHGKLKNSAPKIPDEIRKDVLALVEEESSSLTMEDIKKTLLMPSTHAFSAGQIDKSITLGKVEGAIEAVRTALEKLDAGGNVEDARAVCEPEILKRLIKWNTKLKVYLAPVLHVSRYSSYGRHFTKSDKLQEISDKLQWYVQDGDMVVDFCCGANEFSLLIKEKLDATGKKCSFKNYDIFQAKNDFNFEMRDWMTVRPRELPTGSKLIMGLNPPFGVNARLANQFIDKALTFKPKLLILIVPEETRRLDQKNPQYDLIWEDRESLSGKSFYLPGSIDICDKQIEQWNLKPPVLYLWSRPDWTAKHKNIASSQGHTSKLQPALLYKDSPSRAEEHSSAVYNKFSEEHYMECDATQVESVSIKQNRAISRDTSSNVEPLVPIDAMGQVEWNEDASRAEKHAKERYDTAHSSPEQREPRKDFNKKKHTQDSHGERESTPAHKKLHSDEKTEKNRSEDSKKRKSPDRFKDKTVSSTKVKHWEQHRHETSSRMEMEEVHDMSISPQDVSASGTFEHSSGLEMRSRSSVGRPSSIHDGIDDISKKSLLQKEAGLELLSRKRI